MDIEKTIKSLEHNGIAHKRDTTAAMPEAFLEGLAETVSFL